ncbi:anti-sigma factor [Amycolatopsis sp. NBC_01307]|uniref:anti-sigma factor n=1 Tax=Amycolatopsis sp. NBC_01307 TaxID=2903561 RepID=UPI002E156FA2|nr:anti-sigma factor [Amycolatopsis sp. NBC_01307]
MTTAEAHTLTGAYVLDAVTDLERAAFDRHLAECGTCAAEVRELRETAARLGAAMTAVPGNGLRSRVLTAVAETRQLPPQVAPAAARRTWRKRATIVTASVAAAAAILVGGVGIGLSQTGTTPVPVAGSAQVQNASDAVTVRAGAATATLSRSLGRVVVTAPGLPALDAGHAYQVWLIGPRGPQSAGLLPAGDGTLGAVLPGDTDRVAITTEPAAGSPQPTTAAVARLPLA